jgi:Fe-S oxidoreductase
VYDDPRTVLASLGSVKLIEMPRHGENSFCCGAGGANVWYKVPQKKRVNLIRFEEAQHLKPNVIATACPYCTSMFEDAVVAAGTNDIQVKDIAELVASLIE